MAVESCKGFIKIGNDLILNVNHIVHIREREEEGKSKGKFIEIKMDNGDNGSATTWTCRGNTFQAIWEAIRCSKLSPSEIESEILGEKDL